MRYRRAFVPGASFFFTVVTEGRRPVLGAAEAVEVLREAFQRVKRLRPFELDAVVILPDHLHCVWTLPQGDADFATRWRLIKTWFTKHCEPTLRGDASPARLCKAGQAVWQHRYWEHCLRDEADFAAHVDYVHFNPVKHGYVGAVREWPYSSFARYVDRGVYPPDWGGADMDFDAVGRE
jgi:REP-associated tyrosine transposase